MRNRILIIAAVTILVALIAGSAFWSRQSSLTDTSTKPEKSTPAATPNSPGTAANPASSRQPEHSSADKLRAGAKNSLSVPQPGSRIAGPVSSANPLPSGAPAPPSAANAGRQEGMIGLDKTRRMIIDYHTLMGENPVGTNAEIMKSIMGRNPKEATLGPMEGQQLNGKGELIDEWGTPYFFHQLSGSHMEIHSAGPDKVMGTRDDLILN